VSRIQPDVWDRLTGHSLAGDALAARIALPRISERVLAAVDREGRRHLLIALRPEESDYSDRRSRGIEITTRDLLLMDGTQGRYLDLLCREPLGFEIFDSLGGELAAAQAAEIETPADAARRLVGKWRKFWLSESLSALSREEQIGLFAELWFLAFWLVPRIGLVRAMESWRGPLGARHDMELPECSIEVKATTSGIHRTHWIHGIDQLEVPDSGSLFLFSLALKDEAGGANTLASVVERLRNLPSEDDQTIVRFEAKLAQTGYTNSAHDGSDLRFRIIDERLYRVEGLFPRLRRASLAGGVPSGIEEISYVINLNGLDAYLAATQPEQFSIT
jgi:hypothetical protein